MDSQESDTEHPPRRTEAASTICIESTDDEGEELGSPQPVVRVEGDSVDHYGGSGVMGCGAVVGRRLSAREKLQNFAFQAKGVGASGLQSSVTTPPGREGPGGWAGLQGEETVTREVGLQREAGLQGEASVTRVQELSGSVVSGESSMPASVTSSQNDTGEF